MAMDEREKLAVTSATDVIKQVLTLSTAILTFSVTFSKDIAKDAAESDRWWLQGAWIFLGVAVLAGVWALLALTGTIGRQSHALNIYAGNVRVPSGLQLIAFAAALGCISVFGWFAFTGPDLDASSSGKCSIEAPATGECRVDPP